MRRWVKRIFLLLAALFLPTCFIIAERGSHALVIPARRALEPYHTEILHHQDRHGLRVLEFVAPGTGPALLALPSDSPGTARKSRAVRGELARRGVDLPPFGDTIGTLILLHGRNGRKEDHLPIAERFCAAGFACICVDLPGHGDSPVRHATFGHEEQHQLPGILTAAKVKLPSLPRQTALFGYSQGGAIALQTAAHSKDLCYAVVSIASFSELHELVTQGAERLVGAPLATPAAGLVRLGTRLRAGFDPASINPQEAAAQVPHPVFFVHGAEDRFITPVHAERLYAAVSHPEKHLQVVPGAAHGDVLAVGGNQLYADLAEFFLTHLDR